MPLSRSILFGALLLVLSRLPLTAQDCIALQTASPDSLVAYLYGVTDTRHNAPCVAIAVKSIGEQRYESGIPALTRFLDFRWPSNAHEKQRRIVIETQGFTIYPAAAALEQFGQKALPAILDVLKSPNLSRETLEVAVAVWMTIYKGHAPTGVALLAQEAVTSKDAGEGRRIRTAAFLAAQGWCNPDEEPQCRAASKAP